MPVPHCTYDRTTRSSDFSRMSQGTKFLSALRPNLSRGLTLRWRGKYFTCGFSRNFPEEFRNPSIAITRSREWSQQTEPFRRDFFHLVRLEFPFSSHFFSYVRGKFRKNQIFQSFLEWKFYKIMELFISYTESKFQGEFRIWNSIGAILFQCLCTINFILSTITSQSRNQSIFNRSAHSEHSLNSEINQRFAKRLFQQQSTLCAQL